MNKSMVEMVKIAENKFYVNSDSLEEIEKLQEEFGGTYFDISEYSEDWRKSLIENRINYNGNEPKKVYWKDYLLCFDQIYMMVSVN